uniref:Uncharacterized protein n=1 Tax=Chromera velia CCMP2878 TaxID=1169474 RepID=A0A0G4F1S0_9ALVE|eukprot:Cvel_2629.t1-p1 / transcript=Cvel_2629.t1 / gene=Cvel_2629 / organism=Chromera_velia_CCMP2878 / gene_product=hypothetical protein / transcript_product=hypothetical protein / location=Cvel_scaffold104:43088-43489(-) / protein_length=134 / sequence_SO=supercontig / SO=protein_coding / is_pseudo=false
MDFIRFEDRPCMEQYFGVHSLEKGRLPSFLAVADDVSWKFAVKETRDVNRFRRLLVKDSPLELKGREALKELVSAVEDQEHLISPSKMTVTPFVPQAPHEYYRLGILKDFDDTFKQVVKVRNGQISEIRESVIS